jgi:transcriptional regulator with XRE-family HTH domain
MEEQYIKLIFGLKLKQIRTDKNLSLYGLSKLSGLSKSYLNEIEKGKKYPKTDKIAILSEKLEVPYDHLVSLKLDKNLAPIGRILRSKILKEIPMEHFGIQESTLIDIISNAPEKVNAFITTLIEIAQHYSFTKESFYLASVRSHQEANNNYFDTVEQQVIKFCKAYQIDTSKPIDTFELEAILKEEFEYTINATALDSHSDIEDLRSIFVPKTKTLLLSSSLDEAQRAFIYAKELAYNYLNYEQRLYTFSWVKFDNFDQVLNNFYASYFAGALLIPRVALTENLKTMFGSTKFDNPAFIKLMQSFNASSETFYQRLTNTIPKDFNVLNLFFIRLAYKTDRKDYHIDKELHLIHNSSHIADDTKEHYCRRWVTVDTVHQISQNNDSQQFNLTIAYYPENEQRYLIFSSTIKDTSKSERLKTICLGFLINKQLERKMAFLSHPSLKTHHVDANNTSYQVFDSQNRLEKPVALKKRTRNEAIEHVIASITDDFS